MQHPIANRTPNRELFQLQPAHNQSNPINDLSSIVSTYSSTISQAMKVLTTGNKEKMKINQQMRWGEEEVIPKAKKLQVQQQLFTHHQRQGRITQHASKEQNARQIFLPQ